METYRNNSIVISGPSGSGKTELIEYIKKANPQFVEAVGMTTRQKRNDEEGNMNFISISEFESLILNDKFIEYCTYNGNYYGVCKEELNKLLEHHLIFNVSYSSAKEIKKTYQQTQLIYLLPPTKEELLRRIGERGYDRYLLGIEETMKNAFYYEYLLISQTNDLETTYTDFIEIVGEKSKSKQRKLTLVKNRNFIRNFYK